MHPQLKEMTMGIYSSYLLPKIVHWSCRQKPNRKQRQKIVPKATGSVLEIGIGSGLNLPFYDPDLVTSVTGIDPSLEMWEEHEVKPGALPFDFEFVQSRAEKLPFEGDRFDSAVITYSLCTIPGPDEALDELRRVLKPGGTLYFCEHGRAPDPSVEKWQNRVNPLWKRLGGGCNLNRDIPALVTDNGFSIIRMETMYIPGWKPASFNYWGSATVR